MNTPPEALVVARDATRRSEWSVLVARLSLTARAYPSSVEAAAAFDRQPPALALLEVEAGGFELCHELAERYDDRVAVILFSARHNAPSDRVAGLLIGAEDYVNATIHPDELLARARRAMRRTTVLPRAPMASDGESLDLLSGREREVLTMLAAGLPQKQVATRLSISDKTVGTHIQHILAKLGMHSRTDAVALAVRSAASLRGAPPSGAPL